MGVKHYRRRKASSRRALAEVLLRGFSQARMTRLIALLRSQNPDFEIVPDELVACTSGRRATA